MELDDNNGEARPLADAPEIDGRSEMLDERLGEEGDR